MNDPKKNLPAAIANDPIQDVPSGVKIAQTYFSKSKRRLEVGVGYDGTLLNHHNYVNTKDENGDEIQGMEYRFCSSRAGQKEKNERGGYEALYVDPVTNRPLPKESGGKMVPLVGGMTLCVRKTEHGDMRRNHLEQMAMRKPAEKAAQTQAFLKEEGLENLVRSEHKAEKIG